MGAESIRSVRYGRADVCVPCLCVIGASLTQTRPDNKCRLALSCLHQWHTNNTCHHSGLLLLGINKKLFVDNLPIARLQAKAAAKQMHISAALNPKACTAA